MRKLAIVLSVATLLLTSCSPGTPDGTVFPDRPKGPTPSPLPDAIKGGLEISNPGGGAEVVLPFQVSYTISVTESRIIELSANGSVVETFTAPSNEGEFTVSNAPLGTYDLVFTLKLADGTQDPSFRSRVTLRGVTVNPNPEN